MRHQYQYYVSFHRAKADGHEVLTLADAADLLPMRRRPARRMTLACVLKRVQIGGGGK